MQLQGYMNYNDFNNKSSKVVRYQSLHTCVYCNLKFSLYDKVATQSSPREPKIQKWFTEHND